MSEKSLLFFSVTGFLAAVGGLLTLGVAIQGAQANLALFGVETQSSTPSFIFEGQIQAVDAADHSFDLKVINPFPPSPQLPLKNLGFLSYRLYTYDRTILNYASLSYADKALTGYVPGSLSVLSRTMAELKVGMRVRVFGKRVSDDGMTFRYQADIINTVR